MKICLLLVLLFSIVAFGKMYSQIPVVKWWFNTKDAAFGQSAAGDIDGDGKLEIVFGCYRNDSNVYALNAENGTLLWKYNTHVAGAEGCNDVAPVIFDVDSDGLPEVIVPSSCNPVTFCFDGRNGEVKWQCKTVGSDSPPTIADIDGDGNPEILHGQFGGYVICIEAKTGSRKWNIPVDTNSWVQTAPTIFDADGDGRFDFVVGTWNLVDRTKSGLYAFRGDTQALLWSYPTGDWMYHGTAVADLDSDGKPEVVAGAYNDTLFCLEAENGAVKWKYDGGGYIGAPASIADIDNDGVCDVVFVSGNTVAALSNTGVLKWSYAMPVVETAFRGVALADVNNDEFTDVIFGTSGGKLTALHGRNGSVLWSIDLAAHSGISGFGLDHAPIIADFDGDGLLDVFIIGGYTKYPEFQNNRGRAYMLTIGKGNGPDWLMFQHDIRRQSSICGLPATAVEEKPKHDNDTILVVSTPPHTSSLLRFANPSGEPHTLIICNVLGQTVSIVENILHGETPMSGLGLHTGLYFFLLKNRQGAVGQGKFVVY